MYTNAYLLTTEAPLIDFGGAVENGFVPQEIAVPHWDARWRYYRDLNGICRFTLIDSNLLTISSWSNKIERKKYDEQSRERMYNITITPKKMFYKEGYFVLNGTSHGAEIAYTLGRTERFHNYRSRGQSPPIHFTYQHSYGKVLKLYPEYGLREFWHPIHVFAPTWRLE